MLPVRLCFISFFCGLFLSFGVGAQVRNTDAQFNQELLTNAYRTYLTQVGDNTQLYNGTEYARPYRNVIGHQFFDSNSFQKGSVLYDGIQYQDVLMAYDLVGDELIIKAYQNLNLKLVTEKITSFSFSGHMFVRIEHDSNTTKLQTGFYEILNAGPLLVLVMRKKIIERPKVENPSIFSEYDYYFLKKEDVFYPIDTKRSLISVFNDHKNEIKKYLRKTRLNFKKDRANTIVKTVEYYTQIKK